MDKVKKIALILLIWLLTIFFISVAQISPLSISTTTASVFQIPVIFWLILLISPFLLYLIAKDSKNPLVPLACVILYFFLFYSWGLYFFSHPTISDIGSSTRYQEILSSIAHIGPQEIDAQKFVSASRYFRWPVYFIFSKVFSTTLGIGSIQTINLGFFSLLLILPFLLSLFFKRTNRDEITTIYFITPALYLTLGWHFINDQFVPQFLALLYLIILFGCYLKYRNRKNPLFLLLMIIFYALIVFSHPFMFLFFLVAIIFEIYWLEYVEMKRSKFISYGLIIIFISMLFPYYSDYYSLASSATGGQSWRTFQQFFSQRSPGEAGYQVQKFYHLVPRIFDQLMSNLSRVIITVVFLIVVIGLLYYIIKKRKLFDFDISILIGSASWFVLGLANLVLGQRALQIAALPLARQLKYSRRLFKHMLKVIVVFIIIAPSAFVANSMVNSSIAGDKGIQDSVENIAGRFMDKHITNESIISSAQNPYPTGYPSGFRNRGYIWKIIDFVLISPKLQKQLTFLNINYPIYYHNSVIYDNEDIEIVSLQIEER